MKVNILFKVKDECIYEMRNKLFKESYYLALYTIIFINFISLVYLQMTSITNSDYVAETNKNVDLLGINLLIVLIPSFYFTVLAIKRGLILPRINKKGSSVSHLNKFRLRCLYGAIFFGAFMGIASIGHSTIKGSIIVAVLGGGFWGTFFYLANRLLMKVSERNANKKL